MSNVRSLWLLAIIACSQPIAWSQFRYEGTVNYQPDAIQLFGCAFSANGTYLVTGGDCVRVFHADTGQLLQQMRPTLRPRELEAGSMSLQHYLHQILKNQSTRWIAFSPVMKDVFATGGDDGVVRIWRVSDRKPLHTLKGHKGGITALAFSPSGRLLATGAADRKNRGSIDQFRLWDAVSGELLETDDFYNDGVRSITFLDDETVVFTRNDNKLKRDSVIEFFEISSWSLVRSMRFSPGIAFDVAFTPRRDRMIIAGGECIPLGPNSCRPTGYLWLADMRGDGAKRVKTDPHGYFNSLALVGSDRFVTSTSIVDGGRVPDYLEMRSATDGKVLWSVNCGTASGFGSVVSPDGKEIAYCQQKQVVFLDASTGKQTRTIEVIR